MGGALHLHSMVCLGCGCCLLGGCGAFVGLTACCRGGDCGLWWLCSFGSGGFRFGVLVVLGLGSVTWCLSVGAGGYHGTTMVTR